MKKEIKKQRVLSVEGRNGIGGAGYRDPGIGMRWYKLLIILLIFDALVGAYDAVLYMTGSVHFVLEDGSTVWMQYPATKIIDITYGIAIIARVVFEIYVWWQLKNKTKKTRNFIMIMYIISYMSNAIYLTCFGFAVNNIVSVGFSIITNIVTCIVMVSLSYIYFSKRADLFEN